MANISAKQVVALREKTGVGMMKCKEALVKTDGDMEQAIKLLREQGLAAAVKKASRIAAEGAVAVYNKDGVAVLVEVNSETDFVAKNEKFLTFANNIASIAAAQAPADIDALLACKYVDSDLTVEDMRKEMILVIGENINIRRFERVEGNVYTYNHGNGKIGVIVKFNEPVDPVVGKNVCMQVASMNPRFISRTDVPQAELDSEREIASVQLKNDPKNANKPENIFAKMIEGKLGKFYSANCLDDQEFILDSNLTVAKFIASKHPSAKVEYFVRYEKGEGIQKREDNFAEEVAKMSK